MKIDKNKKITEILKTVKMCSIDEKGQARTQNIAVEEFLYLIRFYDALGMNDDFEVVLCRTVDHEKIFKEKVEQ